MRRSHKARVHSFTSIITNTIRRCHHASSCVYALLKLSYVSLLTLVFRFHYGTNDHEPLAGLSLRNPRLGASAPQDPKNWKIQGCNFVTNSFCKKCIWRCLGGARGGTPAEAQKVSTTSGFGRAPFKTAKILENSSTTLNCDLFIPSITLVLAI